MVTTPVLLVMWSDQPGTRELGDRRQLCGKLVHRDLNTLDFPQCPRPWSWVGKHLPDVVVDGSGRVRFPADADSPASFIVSN